MKVPLLPMSERRHRRWSKPWTSDPRGGPDESSAALLARGLAVVAKRKKQEKG